MGSLLGTLKISAKKIGVSFDEYQRRVSSGEKWCMKCREWKRRNSFGKDRSRYDGLAAVCLDCRICRVSPGPTIRMRRAMRPLGLAWCSGCKAWIVRWDVRGGQCRKCARAWMNHHYATNAEFRHKRIELTRSRKKNVAPIPFDVAQEILESFGGKCAYCCQRPATTWDHITPVSEGGVSRRANLLPACRSCNSSKHAKDVEEWLDSRPDLQPAVEALEQIVLERYIL